MSYFFRRPRFSSQYPDGSSQSSVTPVAGDIMDLLTSASTRHAYGTYMQGKHSCIQNEKREERKEERKMEGREKRKKNKRIMYPNNFHLENRNAFL